MSTSTAPQWFLDADAAAVEVQRDDPTATEVGGLAGPREWVHGELRLRWMSELVAAPTWSVRLAVRAAHLGRYNVARTGYPQGRAGYLRWRQALYDIQADRVYEILLAAGAPRVDAEHARALVGKSLLGQHPDAALVQDTLALVFFEADAAALLARTAPEVAQRAVRKTLVKMSRAGREALGRARLAPEVAAAVAATSREEGGI